MEHFRMEFDNGEEFETSPDNTELYRYVGNLAIMNHVYMEIDDEISLYVFAQSSAYPYLEELATMNRYPIHDNLQGATQSEVNAFNDHIDEMVKNIPDEVPEEWQYED